MIVSLIGLGWRVGLVIAAAVPLTLAGVFAGLVLFFIGVPILLVALVAGGVLDRNPGAHILFAEHSAGWLWGLAERMDEVYNGHAPSISPKLSRLPSQSVRDQVHCALQNDGNSSMAIRKGVGIDALLFATDYPHSEGTFPFSKQVIDKLVVDNPDVTEDELVAILGGNAAKLFKRANLGAAVAARRLELLAA